MKLTVGLVGLVVTSLVIGSCFLFGEDLTPPAEVTGLSVLAGDGQVVLSWTDPEDNDLARVEITWTPDGTTAQEAPAGVETYNATGLNNGNEYVFTVSTADTSENVSAGIQIAATPVVQAVAQATLVAAYRFNGNANDESGNGHHGTIDGAVFATDRSETVNSALTLDGVDDFVSTDLVAIENLTEVTVAAWIRTSNSSSLSIVSKYRHGSGSDTDDSFYLGVGGTAWWQLNAGNEWSGVSGTTDIADGQWHHVAGTWDGSNMLIYVDGVMEGTTPYSGTGGGQVNDTVLPVVIGVTVNDGGGPRYFDGQIDDVHVYRSALTVDEVLTLFGNGG